MIPRMNNQPLPLWPTPPAAAFDPYPWWPYWTKDGRIVPGSDPDAHKWCNVNFRVAESWYVRVRQGWPR